MRKAFLFMLMTGYLSCYLFGQNKYEREYRISVSELPEMARDFVDACHFTRKVKWYKEEGLSNWSLEAKVKHMGTRFSIEFDSTGVLEDIEQIIPWSKVPPDVQPKILGHLDEIFSRHRFIKIQEQWTGEPEALLRLVQGQDQDVSFVSKYELVVKGKGESGTQWYEFLFDAQGQFQHKAQIIFRNTDNLDF